MLIPLAFGAIGGLVGRTQSTAVQGTLTCNGRPLKNVLVKLYDNDRGIISLVITEDNNIAKELI